MSQEATMICVDNSEWMRNGDFSPSRFESQLDAVNILCGAKTRQNVENAVGLLTCAGRAVEVQVTLTQDMGKMITALHKIKIGGDSDIVSGIQVAQLALRNRQNKRQEQRIILFVGSPVKASAADLKKIGAQLKKNKVAVDIINFGEDSAEENEEKLRALFDAVANHDNSNIVTIPPGTTMLADALHHTAIIKPGATGTATGGTATGTGGGTGGLDFEIDPNLDPELAIAIRLSMETAEQERRTRAPDAEMKDAPGSNPTPAAPTTVTPAPSTAPSTAAPSTGAETDEMDPELAEAIRLSMMTDSDVSDTGASGNRTEEDKDREPSKGKKEPPKEPAKEPTKEPVKEPEPTNDPMDVVSADDLASFLSNLPGVDSSDPALLEVIKKTKEEEEKKKKGQ